MNSRQAFIFNHFKTLITSFDGSVPFHLFFKKYSKTNTALGSKDRRILREIIYSTYRLGLVWKEKSVEELFLIPNKADADELLKAFYQDIPAQETETNFISTLSDSFSNLLIPELQNEVYYKSLQLQPLVWVRVNHLNAEKFKQKYHSDILEEIVLNKIFISFGLKNNTVIADNPFPVEIQDYASQMVSSKIKLVDGQKIWDCCSGSGGKSLFLSENFPKVKVYASDIRESILQNLKTRFKQSRLPLPKISCVDLNKKPEKINFEGEIIGRHFFDVIIADVPCSGSGTWAREPENLTFFNPNKLDEMVNRQVNIVKNSLRFLAPGGRLYYITCSVFEQENEGVILELEKLGTLKILKKEMIYGYDKRADNLFIAEMQHT